MSEGDGGGSSVIDWEDPLDYQDLVDGLTAWCKYALPDDTLEDYLLWELEELL